MFYSLKQKDPVIAQELNYCNVEGKTIVWTEGNSLTVFFLPEDGVKKANFFCSFCERELDGI